MAISIIRISLQSKTVHIRKIAHNTTPRGSQGSLGKRPLLPLYKRIILYKHLILQKTSYLSNTCYSALWFGDPKMVLSQAPSHPHSPILGTILICMKRRSSMTQNKLLYMNFNELRKGLGKPCLRRGFTMETANQTEK